MSHCFGQWLVFFDYSMDFPLHFMKESFIIKKKWRIDPKKWGKVVNLEKKQENESDLPDVTILEKGW